MANDGRTWRLHPLRVPGCAEPVDITVDGLTLGRHPANDVVLRADRFPGVSGHHARLRLDEDALVLEDLGSRNGTLVDGDAIDSHRLSPGEIFQLGSNGPRFSIVRGAGLDETLEFARPAPASKRSIGPETVALVRSRLGIPEDDGVEALVRRRTHRLARGFALVAVLLLAALGTGWAMLVMKDDEAQASTRAAVDDLNDKLARAHEEVERQREAWVAQGEELGAARAAWEAHKAELGAERDALLASIERLEADERAAHGELQRLHAQLAQTAESLERFDPINLAQTRLAGVRAAERAVVFIEADLSFHEPETDRALYFRRRPDGGRRANFDNEGYRAGRSGSGSGFCVSKDGWILTNAHVVHQKDDDDDGFSLIDLELVEHLALDVVFSGESRRHPAILVAAVGDGDRDLALLKIEPFEGMPYLGDLDLERPRPELGTEVFLIGFPLGKRALQAGDRMIASTFRGIVSRSVDAYLQVDAAVHPGASGGPLIDGDGHVVGVVVGMQSTPDSGGANQIGYIIPVAQVADLWPPPLGER